MIQILGSPSFEMNQAGKKAGNLHQLICHGFNVPSGFVIPFDMNLEQVRIEEWREAVTRIGGFPVAVRSSGILEDLEGASFAGQYQSFLEVQNLEELLEKVCACRASGQTEHVKAYLKKNGLNVNGTSAQVSVLVQKMVKAQIAGVGFSIHPLTGREEHALIEFCKGLGERLVSGQIEPSSVVLSLQDGKTVESHLGSDEARLTENEISELGKVLLEVQAFYGIPQDIEWAFDENGKLWLLQSRPITRIQWRSDVEEFTNADFKDGGVAARVCTPLMYSLYRNAMQGSMQEYFETIRLIPKSATPDRWIDFFYGRAYWNASAVKRYLCKVPGFDEEKFDLDLGIQKKYPSQGPIRVPAQLKTVLPAIPVAIALEKTYENQLKAVEKFEALFAKERDSFLKKIKNFDLTPDTVFFADLIDVLDRFHVWTEQSYFKTIYNNSNAQTDFKSFLAKMDKVTGCHTPVVHLLGGLTDVSHMNMQRGILRLCNVARDYGFTSEAWQKELKTFIEHNYFHSDAELDLSVPRWGEKPEQVRKTVETMLASGVLLNDPDQSAGVQRLKFEDEAAQVEKRLMSRWMWRLIYRRRFRKNLKRVRTYLSRREFMREFSTQCYYIVRMYALEAGRRFVQNGWIKDSNDIFMLKTEEVTEMARLQVDLKKIDSLIYYRNKMYQGYRNFTPPNELGQGVCQRSEESYLQSRDGVITLKGLGCSSGKIEGVVRVIQSLDEMDQIQKGDILVTRFTDPGWTPVLGLVSGIITEVGGLLSHAAVIGREYGIPAILNLPGATQVLTSGQRIRMDGTLGTIEILSHKKAKIVPFEKIEAAS